MSDDQHVSETDMARLLWSLVAPYVYWLDSRPTTPWKGGQRSLEGVIAMAHPVYDDRVEQLERAFYENDVMAREYLETLRAHGVEQPSTDVAATADLELLRAMFTWVWRGERFSDGLIARALDSGLLASLAHRAEELAAG